MTYLRRYGWPLPFAALVWVGWPDLGNLSWWAWAVIGVVVGMFAGWWYDYPTEGHERDGEEW